MYATTVKKITNMPPEEKRYILGSNPSNEEMGIVSVDPNVADKMFCVDTTDQEGQRGKKFRYTTEQYKLETHQKRYAEIKYELLKDKMVGNVYVTKLLKRANTFSHKTLDFIKFSMYLGNQIPLNASLAPLYNLPIRRKLKLGKKLSIDIANANLIKRFVEMYGRNVVVCFGDWSQQNKRFWSLFLNAGFLVYLIDEFLTSKKCCVCQGVGKVGINENFRKCPNPNPTLNHWTGERRKVIERWGLVRCTKCGRLWNRDVNAATNIWMIAYCEIHGQPRPRHLCRRHQLQEQQLQEQEEQEEEDNHQLNLMLYGEEMDEMEEHALQNDGQTDEELMAVWEQMQPDLVSLGLL